MKAEVTPKKQSPQEDEQAVPEKSVDHVMEKLEELSESKRRTLLAYPSWNKKGGVTWVEREGRVVVEYPKNFSKFEKWVHSKIGGPATLKRPLDELGSDIWRLCDGEHTLLEICAIMSKKYREKVEPVTRVVPAFISQLFMLGLVIPMTQEDMVREKAELVEEVEL